MNCPCLSGRLYEECCEPVIKGERKAGTAEELMRSRYSAFVQHEIDYIVNTNHPEKIEEVDRESIEKWAKESEWLGFELLNVSNGTAEDQEGQVEFIASFTQQGIKQEHHELAEFKKVDDQWYFYDGKLASQKPIVRVGDKVGRNDPCPCGSGLKYKKCCGK